MSSTNHSHSAAGNEDNRSIISKLRRRNNDLTEALRVLLHMTNEDDVDNNDNDDDSDASDDGGNDSINRNRTSVPTFKRM